MQQEKCGICIFLRKLIIGMGEDLKKRLGQSLEAARVCSGEKGVSAAEEAKRVSKDLGSDFKVTQASISRYEAGRMWPTIPKLLTLARVYKKPISLFLEAIGASKKEICECSEASREKVKLLPFPWAKEDEPTLSAAAELLQAYPETRNVLDQWIRFLWQDASSKKRPTGTGGKKR